MDEHKTDSAQWFSYNLWLICHNPFYDDKYYLYTADGKKDAICYCTADRPDGPYYEPDDNQVSFADTALEGHCTYKLLGTDKLILIADQFKSGGYFMQETTDMISVTTN